jgi:uncharacterized phiE125 gp8 family phage protein
MWYPHAVTVAAASEPVTLAEAKAQCLIEVPDADTDTTLNQKIKAARAYVEAYTGTVLVSRTVAVKCDCFADMAKLPLAPVASVSSISYVDSAGDTQTLATSVYELRSDGLQVAIVLKYGQSWPSIQSGSRVTLTAVVGYSAIPDDVAAALLLLIASSFHERENMPVGERSAVDSLLANHRIWAV